MVTHSKQTAFRCFAAALMLCIAFVIPTPNLAPDSYPRRLVRGSKKAVLNTVVGLLVVGIAQSVTMCGLYS